MVAGFDSGAVTPNAGDAAEELVEELAMRGYVIRRAGA